MAVEKIIDDDSKSLLKSLSQDVYLDLERMIIDGSLKPGDRINEKSLAEQSGISRGPVREACRRLEEAGLVQFKVNRGFFVRILDIKDVLEIYEVRAGLFYHAGRLLASRLTEAQLDELTLMHHQMQQAVSANLPDKFYELNRNFHSQIMRFTRNQYLSDIYEGLDRELHIWRKRALILDGNVEASCAEHGLILEILRNGNPTRAAQILRDHSLAGRNRLLRTMPQQLSYFESDWEDEN